MRARLQKGFVNDPLHRTVIADISMFKTNLLLASHPIEILLRAASRQIVENGDGPAALTEKASSDFKKMVESSVK